MTHEMGHYDLAYQYLDNFEGIADGHGQGRRLGGVRTAQGGLAAGQRQLRHLHQHGINQGTTLDTSIT